jgi:hypothetical protein
LGNTIGHSGPRHRSRHRPMVDRNGVVFPAPDLEVPPYLPPPSFAGRMTACPAWTMWRRTAPQSSRRSRRIRRPSTRRSGEAPTPDVRLIAISFALGFRVGRGVGARGAGEVSLARGGPDSRPDAGVDELVCGATLAGFAASGKPEGCCSTATTGRVSSRWSSSSASDSSPSSSRQVRSDKHHGVDSDQSDVHLSADSE